MRHVLIKYRIKLSANITIENQLYSLIEGKVPEDDIDLQIIDYEIGLIKEFSNPNLNPTNCYEGYADFAFDDNIENEKFSNSIFTDIDCKFGVALKKEWYSFYQIGQYIIYQNISYNTFYVIKNDLTPYGDNAILEITNLFEQFFQAYIILNNFKYLDVGISSIAISEDSKVCKVVTTGLELTNVLDATKESKLNRILPS